MNWLKTVWCRMFHRDLYWPAHGKYVCKTCLNEFEAPLEIADQVDLLEEVNA